jgi:hypothetical protein
VDSRLEFTEFIHQTIKLIGQRLNFQQNFRIFHICFDPSSKWSSSSRNIIDVSLFETHWFRLDNLADLVSHFGGNLRSIKVHNTLNYTTLTQESLHGIPRSIFLAHQSEYTLEYITDSIWRHSETFDFIDVCWLQASDSSLCCINFRLNL